MKTLTEYKNNNEILSEDFFGNLGIGKKTAIEDWLKKYYIRNYTINDDLTIDVNGSVDLTKYPNKELPEYIQFNYVDQNFDISESKITTLRGCPKKVEGAFYCDDCKNLTSLEGAPKECSWFCCINCQNLTSLKGAPEAVFESFNCDNCKKLTSLEGAPMMSPTISCIGCINLTSLKGIKYQEQCIDLILPAEILPKLLKINDKVTGGIIANYTKKA